MTAVKRLFVSLGCMVAAATIGVQVMHPDFTLAAVVAPLQTEWEVVEQQALVLARFGATNFVRSGQVVALDDVPEDILPPDSLLRQHVGGVFVTYVIAGKNRGCYGSLYARHATLSEGILWAAAKAIWDDPSRSPLTPLELEQAQIAVTVVQHVEPIYDPYRVQPLQEGLYVQAGKREAVLLPGEARTARYMVEWVLQKASIDHPGEARFFKFQGLHFGARLTPADL